MSTNSISGVIPRRPTASIFWRSLTSWANCRGRRMCLANIIRFASYRIGSLVTRLGNCCGSFRRLMPTRGRWSMTSRIRTGTHGSWVICIRTCPRRRGRSTPYYRPPSLSKSSFSTERLIRRSMSLALMPRRCSTAAATRLQQPGFG